MVDQIRIKDIAQLEGLSIKDAARMPHASVLAAWRDAGLYVIDADMGVFRLTNEGRNQIAIKSAA